MRRSMLGIARGFAASDTGLTPKQEIFAQNVANGDTLSDAYRKAYSPKGKTNTVNRSASQLMCNPKLRARVDTLIAKLEAGMHRDAISIRRHVFAGLMAESRNDKARPGERIQALVALGKIDVVGMFREITAVEARKERSPEEIEHDLRAKLRDLFSDKGIDRAEATELRSSDLSERSSE